MYRIFHHLKRYKQNSTFRASFRRPVFPTKGEFMNFIASGNERTYIFVSSRSSKPARNLYSHPLSLPRILSSLLFFHSKLNISSPSILTRYCRNSPSSCRNSYLRFFYDVKLSLHICPTYKNSAVTMDVIFEHNYS